MRAAGTSLGDAALPSVTLCGIVARDARVAVVFRRGPTRHVRMLAWDLARDVVEPGQWLIGTVLTGVSGLSPDGRLLVYAARKGGRVFTAVSRPPYFTALAFFGLDTIAMGGFFTSPRDLVLGWTYGRAREEVDTKGTLRITDVFTHFLGGKDRKGAVKRFEGWDAHIYGVADVHHGFWAEAPGASAQRKTCPTRRSLLLVRTFTRGSAFAARYDYRLVDTASPGREVALGRRDWVDWDHDGSLLLGEEGRLLRQRLPTSIASPLPAPRVVADLRAQKLEPVAPPPWAVSWTARRGRSK